MKNKTLIEIFNNKNSGVCHPLHNFHPFPCKFPAFIPREIINSYAKKDDIICDPFVGSGTTLVEASLLGHSSIGNDINPISCLLSKVKAKPLSINLLNNIDIFSDEILLKYKNTKKVDIFYYDSINHWFQDNVIRELSFLKQEISTIKNRDLRDLFLVVFSSVIVRVSNQESDTRYSAKNKNIKDFETINIFIKKIKDIKNIYIDFSSQIKNNPTKNIDVKVFQSDSRNLINIESNSIDMIITSPPYANTYDYYLYHKHRKYWLDMDIKYAQSNEIGSRHEFSSLKENPLKWEEDIKKCLIEMKRITQKNGKIFLIIGDSVINKKIIKMDKIIKKISEQINLKFIDIASAPMSKHSKMFNPSFSSPFKKQEHLIYLRK